MKRRKAKTVRYGGKVREKVEEIEKKQRKKQRCPFCKKFSIKRIASGIWYCKACKKKFTSGAYYLE